MGSPYPLHYTLRWPFYYWWPSRKNHTGMPIRPLQFDFEPSQRADYLRLIFCGDMMLTQHDIIPQLHQSVRDVINSADLFFGNCEAPVGTHAINHSNRYRLVYHMPEQLLTGVLQQLSLPPEKIFLSVANNHSGDKGRDAYLAGIEVFNKLGVTPLGFIDNSRDPINIIESNGIRIGCVAWTHWMNCEVFAKNQDVIRHEQVVKTNWKQIKKDHQLDVLIGMPHWEFEFQHFPKRNTRNVARTLIDQQGFNLLCGAHPHTLQPIEWFKNGICAYSVGNFFGLGSAWPVRLIPLLDVKISKKSSNKGSILGYQIHCFAQVNGKDKMELVPIDSVPDALRQKFLDRLAHIYETPVDG